MGEYAQDVARLQAAAEGPEREAVWRAIAIEQARALGIDERTAVGAMLTLRRCLLEDEAGIDAGMN